MKDGIHPKPHYTCTRSVWIEEGAEFYDTNFGVSECHPTRMFGTRILSVSEGMSNNVLQVQKKQGYEAQVPVNVVIYRRIVPASITSECIMDNECIHC